uniref:Uncharacterized protein n=1 Tax=CrAss-like virus sp. ctYsL76 TaxID=2826826 RepID=A0A8S5QMV2_9CAUD|nr:MAG TPA: hypothetical protein [CrAss-like virus sp. ctYsL76]
MILSTETHNIKYLAFFNYYHCYGNSIQEIDTLDKCVYLTDLGTRPSSLNHSTVYSSYVKNMPDNAYGIYLGNETIINNEINKKHTDVKNISKLYFDANSKYPRFKLAAVPNICRCIKPEKADCVVINDINFSNYVPRTSVSIKSPNDVNSILILYSAIMNCYYLIDYCPNNIYNDTAREQFKLLLQPFINYDLLTIDNWGQTLIKSGILPSDCEQFYCGPIILTFNNAQTEFLDNLFTKYNKVIYDTELDLLISDNLPPMTDECLQTLSCMLSSSDQATVDMGLKMLSSYDLRLHKCSVSTILLYNWQYCKNSDVYISTGFRQVLQTLNIHPKTIDKYWIEYNINQLYEKCDNPDDLERTKKIIINHLENQIKRDWVEKYTFRYKGVNLTLNVKIE